MNRTNIVTVIGACVTAAGTFLALRADLLASRWQPLGASAWGGTTDPGLRQTYHEIGLIALGFGVALLAAAAWQWMAAGRDASRCPTVHV